MRYLADGPAAFPDPQQTGLFPDHGGGFNEGSGAPDLESGRPHAQLTPDDEDVTPDLAACFDDEIPIEHGNRSVDCTLHAQGSPKQGELAGERCSSGDDHVAGKPDGPSIVVCPDRLPQNVFRGA